MSRSINVSHHTFNQHPYCAIGVHIFVYAYLRLNTEWNPCKPDPLKWGHLHKQDTFPVPFVYLITPEMRTPLYSGPPMVSSLEGFLSTMCQNICTYVQLFCSLSAEPWDNILFDHCAIPYDSVARHISYDYIITTVSCNQPLYCQTMGIKSEWYICMNKASNWKSLHIVYTHTGRWARASSCTCIYSVYTEQGTSQWGTFIACTALPCKFVDMTFLTSLLSTFVIVSKCFTHI